MKIKIIDLLNMIANGEEIPKKIAFKEYVYNYNENVKDYYNEIEDYLFDTYVITDILDNEVIILETTITYNANQLCDGGSEKIEKLHTINNIIGATDLVALRSMQWENNQKFFRKINEIIEVLDER